MDKATQEARMAWAIETLPIIETAAGKTAYHWDAGPDGFHVIYPDDENHRQAIAAIKESPEVGMMNPTFITDEPGEFAILIPWGI